MNNPRNCGCQKWLTECNQREGCYSATRIKAMSDLSLIYDGYAVYQGLTDEAKKRTSPDNVSDVLDSLHKLTKAARQQAVPSGYVMVPVEMTDAMCEASGDECEPGKSAYKVASDRWAEIIAAAPQAEQAPEWGYADTVGNLIAQLRTLDPSTEVYAPHRLPDSRIALDGLTLSREWKLGRWLSAGDGAKRVAVLWTQPDVRAEQAVEPVPSHYYGEGLQPIDAECWERMCMQAPNSAIRYNVPLYTAPPAPDVPDVSGLYRSLHEAEALLWDAHKILRVVQNSAEIVKIQSQIRQWSDKRRIEREAPQPAPPAPDVSGLIQALKQIITAAPSGGPLWHGSEQITEARKQLAAHQNREG